MSACKFSGTDCDGPGANEMCATCYGYLVGHANAVKRLREMAAQGGAPNEYDSIRRAADILEREAKEGRR